MNDPRGSQWRRWDLHVHTKGTKKNDQFKSSTFEEYCIILFKKALEKGIDAIGITDYFTVENYKNVIRFVENIDDRSEFTEIERARIKEIYILPNIELRMFPVTDSGRLVNIHCLVNPSYVDHLENSLFSSIEYAGGSGLKFKMNRQGFIDLGKNLDSRLDDNAAFQRGVKTFVVTISDLQEVLDENKEFRNNVLIVVSNSNKDGVSAFQQHHDFFENSDAGSLEAVRKSIYCNADAIFSSNESDFTYFHGKGVDTTDQVIEKCGSLKPCIHGGDSGTN